MRYKKCLLATFASVFTFCSGAAIAQQCSHTAGSWGDVFSYVWSVSQGSPNGSGVASLSGGVYIPCWSSPLWDVSGTYNVNSGVATVTATNPTGAWEECNGWFTYTGQIFESGCNTGGGTWTNDYMDSGVWSWAKSCDVPSGESNASSEWSTDSGWATAHVFRADLTGGSGPNFGGREVSEWDAAPAVQDGCYQEGLGVLPLDIPDGFSVPLNTSNYYRDKIGWSEGAVTIYRNASRTPCEGHLNQQMKISCAAGPSNYQVNTIQINLGNTTVQVWRGGAYSGSLTWP